MNVVVIPDAAMIVVPLIEKNGHNYLSPSNFSKYDNMDICEGNLSYDDLLNNYFSSEIPSGVRGRLFLFSRVLDKADAAIIIGKRPKNYVRMYDVLNELIIFGSSSCNNAHNLSVKLIEGMNIPTLKLAYPTDKNQIISLISKTNSFLKNLDKSSSSVNMDNLNADLEIKKDKFPLNNLKEILNSLI